MELIILIYGGYTLSVLGFICLLLPFSKRIQNRYVLSFACLMTALGLPYIYIFDLTYSNYYLFGALPAFASLMFFLKYFSRFFRTRPVAYSQAIIASFLFVAAIWGNFITILFIDHCAFGVCA